MLIPSSLSGIWSTPPGVPASSTHWTSTSSSRWAMWWPRLHRDVARPVSVPSVENSVEKSW